MAIPTKEEINNRLHERLAELASIYQNSFDQMGGANFPSMNQSTFPDSADEQIHTVLYGVLGTFIENDKKQFENRRSGHLPSNEEQQKQEKSKRFILNTLRKSFWSYIIKGYIVPGSADPGADVDSALSLPYYHFSEEGLIYFLDKSIVSNFFHNENDYIQRLKDNSIVIDGVTESYVRESVNCYFSSCPKASMVMLGVAMENLFIRLEDEINNHAAWKEKIGTGKERSLKARMKKFNNKLESSNLDIDQIIGIENCKIFITALIDHIRQYRNDGAHAELPQRDAEDAIAMLEVFTRVAKILTQLREEIKNNPTATF